MQESINGVNQGNRSLEDEFTEPLEIQGKNIFFKENEVHKQMILLTASYSLTISSSQLSKEELRRILESIDLSVLN
ncbi:hypothetical protein HNQ35_001889 [Cerasibacillus quisquiliarum]|uniref:Uncharacterized protein n=2 Tax=Cerasibacillus quisquiliarum TaxID=227865 RepID=A0A511UXM9_9BACI|nr:hypothetical protein [Cerasibacillus quisquiliarum]MBB5146680.1 hypothetical protein [Cerasibacillus quisquiliarum]GEN31379.1 hypothetical protein CQU01_16170 [Cerasibacillus quisquiliarum]